MTNVAKNILTDDLGHKTLYQRKLEKKSFFLSFFPDSIVLYYVNDIGII